MVWPMLLKLPPAKHTIVDRSPASSTAVGYRKSKIDRGEGLYANPSFAILADLSLAASWNGLAPGSTNLYAA